MYKLRLLLLLYLGWWDGKCVHDHRDDLPQDIQTNLHSSNLLILVIDLPSTELPPPPYSATVEHPSTQITTGEAIGYFINYKFTGNSGDPFH